MEPAGKGPLERGTDVLCTRSAMIRSSVIARLWSGRAGRVGSPGSAALLSPFPGALDDVAEPLVRFQAGHLGGRGHLQQLHHQYGGILLPLCLALPMTSCALCKRQRLGFRSWPALHQAPLFVTQHNHTAERRGVQGFCCVTVAAPQPLKILTPAASGNFPRSNASRMSCMTQRTTGSGR